MNKQNNWPELEIIHRTKLWFLDSNFSTYSEHIADIFRTIVNYSGGFYSKTKKMNLEKKNMQNIRNSVSKETVKFLSCLNASKKRALFESNKDRIQS